MFKMIVRFIKHFEFSYESILIIIFLSLLYLYNITITYLDEPMTMTYNETTQQMDTDSEEDETPEEVVKEVENFENRPKSNLDETEIVNFGDTENVK